MRHIDMAPEFKIWQQTIRFNPTTFYYRSRVRQIFMKEKKNKNKKPLLHSMEWKIF